MKKMYSINQLAEILGVHRNTILNWIKIGKVKAVRIGNLWRISEEEIEVIKQGFELENK